MKVIKYLFGLCVIICSIINVSPSLFAQGNKKGSPTTAPLKKINALTIGDVVPDVPFQNVLNYKNRKARISDFAGKLLILDIWSVSCTSCIKAFPKMEELQKKFKDAIQILLVNPHDARYDSEEKVKTTLNNLKIRTGFYPSLPIPIHDSILNHYFPHQVVPHVIWLDGNRKVVAITDSRYVTEEAIKSYLERKELKLPVKTDIRTFDNTKPLLVDNNGGDAGDFLFRSLFTGYKGELGFVSGVRAEYSADVIGVFKLNRTLFSFVEEAYADKFKGFNYNRVFLDVKDPARFKREFDTSNAYCYDLTIPVALARGNSIQQCMREDLRRYFNIAVKKEKRKIKCLVFTITKGADKLVSKYQKKDEDLEKESIKKYIRNYSVDEALYLLDHFNIPMVNETGITGNIDIEFPDHFNLSDKEALLKFLKDIGFDINEEERELDVVVIMDK